MDKDVLKEKVHNTFGKLGYNIPPERMEACHRISKKSSTVIVKFTKRKDCQQVWSVKKDLEKAKIADVKLPCLSKLYINRSLCPYYKVKCSVLHFL